MALGQRLKARGKIICLEALTLNALLLEPIPDLLS
jgi:hypothetical protein